MDAARSTLPIPLWLEYSRTKRALAAKRHQSSPHLNINHTSLQHSCLAQGPPPTSTLKPVGIATDFSISLSEDEGEIAGRDYERQARVEVAGTQRKSQDSALKRSITTLKRSVADLKKSSQEIYKHLSSLSTSSPRPTPSPMPSLSSLLSRTQLRATFHPKSLSLVDTGTQIDHARAHPPAVDTYESVGKWSNLPTENKPDLLPLLLSEEEYTQHSFAEEIASTAESTVTPSKGKGIGQKRESMCHTEPSCKRSNTMPSLVSPAEPRKSTNYFMKVASVNGKFYDSSGLELVLGKPINQGIRLQGPETSGGFRLFTSAQECMNSDLQPASPRKGSRVGLMKVSASGPSLRYFLCSLSDKEVVFTCITPQDIIPMIAANVLVTTPSPSQKRRF